MLDRGTCALITLASCRLAWTGGLHQAGLTLAHARIEDADHESNSYLLIVSCLFGHRREIGVISFHCQQI
jgi:hypothetical protein